MTESPVVDFDVLFYDHLIKEEPKLVNKVFSAQRRDELEKRRVPLNLLLPESDFGSN